MTRNTIIYVIIGAIGFGWAAYMGQDTRKQYKENQKKLEVFYQDGCKYVGKYRYGVIHAADCRCGK